MLLFIYAMLVVPAISQVATPPRKIGFSYIRGHPFAKVSLEVYLDLLCPGSKETWPHIKSVADYYGPENVALTIHLFPLPYHQNAFYATRATFVIHYLTNGTKTFDWIEKIFSELTELLDGPFHNKSDSDLLELFGKYVTEMGINATSFLQLVDRRNNNQFERYTRAMWKHACVRGVAGTPTYIVNGFIQPNIRGNWELANWTAFIEPLLTAQLFDDIDNLPDSPHQQVTLTPCTEKRSGSSAALPITQFGILLVVVAFLCLL